MYAYVIKLSLNMLFQKQAVVYLLASFFSGLSTAFLYPLLSLYMITKVGATPIAMGVFLTIMVLSGVAVSQVFAKKSDQGMSRKLIIMFGQTGYMVATVILALTEQYFVALFAVVVFMSMGASGLPQVFTMGRYYADEQLKDKATLFMTMLRSAIAVAWVVGPPLAFIVNDHVGFAYTFSLAGLFALIVLVICLLFLPNKQSENVSEPDSKESKQDESAEKDQDQATIKWYKISGVALYLVCVLFIFCANNMYITSISLYVTLELNESAKWVGYFMGLAALIEIPIMIGAGLLAPKFGTTNLIYAGCLSGLAFFTGILFATEIWQLLVLQVFNGLCIGINASLCIVLVQDLMKKQMGLATTLVNNTQQLSMLLSSLVVGAIAQYINYYTVFVVCVAFCIVGLIAMWFSHNARKQQPVAVNAS